MIATNQTDVLLSVTEGDPLSGPTHFAFARPGTRLFDTAQRVRAMLADDPHYRRIRQEMEDGRPIRMRTHLTVKNRGDYDLSAVQISFEERDAAAALGFRCESFFWTIDRTLTRFEFPDDPRLPGARRLHDRAQETDPSQGGFSVLRYMAGKRLTFRQMEGARGGPTTIGKVLSGPAAASAFARLTAINRAVQGRDLWFKVAPALKVDPEDGLFLQGALPGRPASESLHVGSCAQYCHRVGTLHADIHGLPVADAGSWNLEDYRRVVHGKVQLLAHLWPEHGADLTEAAEALRHWAPQDRPAQHVLCHGDFGWAQMLLDGDAWGVIDFDGSVRADPYLEIAKFVADMRSQPLFRDHPDMLSGAIDAYLGGYCEETGAPLDPLRLDWYRLSAEIAFLVRAVKKDRVVGVDLAEWVGTLRTLSRRLRESGRAGGTST